MDVTVGRQWANTADDGNVLIHHRSKSMRLWVVYIASIVACNRKCRERTVNLLQRIFQEGKEGQDDRIEPKDIIL